MSKEGLQAPRLVLVVTTPPTAVADHQALVQGLRSVAPNPSLQSTRIDFELGRAVAVDLAVYSIDGRRVRTLARGPLPAGMHSRRWDGRDDAEHELASGVYVVRLATSAGADARKIVRVR